MVTRVAWLAIFILRFVLNGFAQDPKAIATVSDVDTIFIASFPKANDARLFYGGQWNRLILASLRDGAPDHVQNIYKNTNDFLGIGITYKWLDGDLSFSLPGTTYLKEERSNLDQFKLSASMTRRKFAYRGYLSDSKGVVISGNDNEYQSNPSLHEFRIGLQVTYVLNEKKYSYRAALYQSELQKRTAGSFLFRVESFFRNLGGKGQPMVPEAYDLEQRFGDQVGLTYIKAPGVIFMPGYGVNFVLAKSRFFISPVIFAGAGAAFNKFQGDKGKSSHVNVEYNAYFLLNAGYNASPFYCRVQLTYNAAYSPIHPAYLTSANLMATFLVGFRFKDLSNSTIR